MTPALRKLTITAHVTFSVVGVKIFYAVVGVLVLVVVMLHLTGHGFGGHVH